MTTDTAPQRGEVWLKGNVRPALGLVLLLTAAVAGGAVIVLLANPPVWVAWVTGGVGFLLAVGAAALTWAATQPRIERRGSLLRVRLSPHAAHDVPLEIVECVFLGSQPIGAADAEAQRLRVGTLVVRLAERAADWRERSTFKPWGSWQDGHVVVDGRWCEPLSLDVARGVSARLVEAKRGLAGTVP